MGNGHSLEQRSAEELQCSRRQTPTVGMFLDALQGKEQQQEEGEGRHGADLLKGSDWRTLETKDSDWLKVFQ